MEDHPSKCEAKAMKVQAKQNSLLCQVLSSRSGDGLRIGQLIATFAAYGGWKDNDVFYCPDEIILRGMEEYLRLKGQGVPCDGAVEYMKEKSYEEGHSVSV